MHIGAVGVFGKGEVGGNQSFAAIAKEFAICESGR